MGVAGFQRLRVRVGMAQPRLVFTENRKGLSESGGRGGGGRGQSDGPSAPAHHSVQPQCLDGKEVCLCVCVCCLCVVCDLAEFICFDEFQSSSVFHDSLSGYFEKYG